VRLVTYFEAVSQGAVDPSGGWQYEMVWMGGGALAGEGGWMPDGNGNVVALVNAADGTETARYEYGPFAEPIRLTGPAATLNPFRFSTKRTDNTTDLVLYEYRVYSPTLGRWPNHDPIDELGHQLLRSQQHQKTRVEAGTLYSFVRNDPMRVVDVLGEHAVDDCWSELKDCRSEGARRYAGSDPTMIALYAHCEQGCVNDLNRCILGAVGPDVPRLKADCAECDFYSTDDEYFNTGAKCFCKCAGNSDWSQYVRGCLRRLYDLGVSPHTAHITCDQAADLMGYDRPWGTLAYCFVKCFDYNPFN